MTEGREPFQTMWVYRYLQVLMVVENVSKDLTLAAPWRVSRWVLTDGSREWTETYAWQWTKDDGANIYGQPDVPPGGKAEWTWMVAPIPPGAWVKTITFVDPWGNSYVQTLGKPEGGQWNYVECGEPQAGSC